MQFKATILALMLSASLQAQTVLRTDSAYIHFISEAPLEIIEAESSDCLGVLRMSDRGFLFKVRIRSFQGFNSPLQREHFNENYMESDEFTDALFKGTILDDLDDLGTEWTQTTVKGLLTVHGVEQERVLNISLRRPMTDIIEYKAEFDVRLEDHDIEVPRIVFQKLAEVIHVSARGSLR